MPHDVFISYAKPNRAVAEALCAKLEQEQIVCWMAPRDVMPGASWAGALVDAIGNSRLLIVVFSSHSNTSPWVIEEVRLAKKKRTPILPFRIEDVLPSDDMEFFLGSPQWLDALPPPPETHLSRLTSAVVKLIAKAPPAVATSPSRAEQIPATLSSYLKRVREEAARNFSTELMRPDRVYVPQYAVQFSGPKQEMNLANITDKFWVGRERRIVLLGNYGMGKSYYAWRATLEQLETCEREREQPIPILYPLKRFDYAVAMEESASRRDILDQILNYANSLDFPRVERKQFTRWLEDGVVHLILDGLDELPLPRHKNWTEFLEPLSKLDGASFVITSRPWYIGQPQKKLEDYAVYELLPWGEREWHLYLDYSSEALSAAGGKQKLLASIAQKPKLASLTTRPLWCYMIVSIADEIPGLDDLALSGLYQQFLNSAVRRKPRYNSVLPLSWQYYAMERFAEESLRYEISSWPEGRLLSLLSQLFETVGFEDLRDYLVNQFRTYAFLNCDHARQYNFGHKSFEDYFTATGTVRWLAEQSTGKPSGPRQIQQRQPLIHERLLSEVQLSLLVGVLQEPWIQESLEIIPPSGKRGLQTRVLLFLQRELVNDHSPGLLRVNLFRIYLAMLRAESDQPRPLLNGLCLKGANLAGKDLTNCTFQNVDFTEAILSKARFAQSSFADCVFFGAMIDGADFTEADLTDADFRGIELAGEKPNFSQARGIDRIKMRMRERRSLF